MYIEKKLQYCPYGSCKAVVDDIGVHLVSYWTQVVTITDDGWLTCTGTYSATTRKHIGCFMKQYGNGYGYYTVKYAYEHNVAINIETGDIMSNKTGEFLGKYGE